MSRNKSERLRSQHEVKRLTNQQGFTQTKQCSRNFTHASLLTSFPHDFQVRSLESSMKNPLDSLWGTVICGFALTLILFYLVRSAML
jgi:hypothetical protein